MNDILNDPEFLEWESNLVGESWADFYVKAKSEAVSERFGEPLRWFRYRPGPNSQSSNTVQPMFDIKRDMQSLNNIEAMTMKFPHRDVDLGDSIL